MKSVPIADIRNVVIMGHTGSGKTTLTEAVLHRLGISERLGSVVAGTSVSDFTEEEKARKTSIYASTFVAKHAIDGRPYEFVWTDTPGYADFYGQMVAAARAADVALIAVDAVAGVQVGAMRAWRLCEAQGKARGIVITGLDRDNASFEHAMESIRNAWGALCVPVMLPTTDRKGVVDVLAPRNTAGDLAEGVDAVKQGLVEKAAETDDQLIEKYLNGENLSADEVSNGLRHAVAASAFVPVFVCLALQEIGIAELLDGVARLFPSPAEITVKDAAGNTVDTSPDAPLCALVWRSINDPFIGQLTLVRVFGGTLKSDSEIYNFTKGAKERVAACLALNGKNQETVPEATAGDIIALAKLKNTAVNDVLGHAGHPVAMAPIVFPKPVATAAVRAKSKGDEDKIGIALHRLTDEDPTIHMERNAETHEMLLSGLGDVHLEMSVDRMKRRSGVEVTLSTPKVPYRETVTATGEGHHKHKKQSGGRGQYGEVYLRVGPRDPADEEWFEDAVVGGVIPHNFIPAVQKGLVEGITRGALAGYPVMNVKVSVYDGSYHDVDSSEIAFKIAGSRALRDGLAKARPVLLEPVMTVRVTIPDAYMGDINGDLNHRRGRILGVDMEDGLETITAEVPMVEMFRYAAELRSITGGQGSFDMEFARYDIVPANLAQKIIAESEKHHEEEGE